MKVLYPGHRYALDNLKDDGRFTDLQFAQEGPLHPPAAGPSCQEVIRALIDRVQTLDREMPWEGNQTIIRDLRHALAGFEARALLRKAEKGLAVEKIALDHDGHFILTKRDPQ
jgi:hypothetical protein